MLQAVELRLTSYSPSTPLADGRAERKLPARYRCGSPVTKRCAHWAFLGVQCGGEDTSLTKHNGFSV
eukprot:scaffold482_cov118-Isochrysis_galbana.AAC.2